MSLATRNKPRPVCRTRTLFAGAIAYACLPGLRRDIRRHLARDVLRHVVRDAGLDVYGVWRGGVQAPPASDVRFSPVGIEDRVLRYWHRFRDRTDMARTRPSLTTHPLRHPLSSFLLSSFFFDAGRHHTHHFPEQHMRHPIEDRTCHGSVEADDTRGSSEFGQR